MAHFRRPNLADTIINSVEMFSTNDVVASFHLVRLYPNHQWSCMNLPDFNMEKSAWIIEAEDLTAGFAQELQVYR